MRTKVVIINSSQIVRGLLKEYIVSESPFLDVIEVGFNDHVLEILNREAEDVILIILGGLYTSKITSKDVIEYVKNHDFLYFVPMIIILDYATCQNRLFYGQDLLDSFKTDSCNFGIVRHCFTHDDFRQALKLAIQRRTLKK
ncbi:hypothetical protein A0J48_012670 [Sphaerospermopsis aphanizomenoides BCCUSP55]|uniref:hypothetical protein n=1 Tax=Sphaerospermopsis aphanizomenoides TaxID=459663 RepID=UPI0019055C5F|nr:hypothetical protein [Sphaerospermopsis aphanizomenoides]MBK1988381.1 hypothetical protein [Sphaerospermopsis aphanizomenoides BCCUSP55]